MKDKILVSWSGGKDSVLSLNEIIKSNEFEIVSLFTVFSEVDERTCLHSTRNSLIEYQAHLLTYPLIKIPVTSNDKDNHIFETRMSAILQSFKEKGVVGIVFGDLFLADLKRYREDNLAKVGMKGIFPIWQKNTTELANSFINYGFKAIITCVDLECLDESNVGKEFDNDFIASLPPKVDPCGENGEFHTFVFDGPLFKDKINLKVKDKFVRDGHFCYCDIEMNKSVYPAKVKKKLKMPAVHRTTADIRSAPRPGVPGLAVLGAAPREAT